MGTPGGWGGEFSSITVLRRVGVGVAFICQDTGLLLFAARSNLPGLVQTVPRGEAYAMYLLLTLVQPMAVIDFVTDNFNVYNLFNQGPVACGQSTNCDLWQLIFQVAYDKAIILTVRWMPSHLKENPTKGVYSCLSNLDIEGNAFADEQAGLAAVSACVPLNVSAPILYYVNLVKRIQLRLATILLNLPDRPKHIRAAASPVVPLSTLIASSSHLAFEEEKQIRCARCHVSFSKVGSGLKHWLSTQCRDQGSNTDRPVPLTLEEVHRGRSCSHHTHQLYIYCGLIYCNRCGVRAGKLGLRKMSKPCEPPTEYGKQSLTAIRAGKINIVKEPKVHIQNIGVGIPLYIKGDPIPRRSCFSLRWWSSRQHKQLRL